MQLSRCRWGGQQLECGLLVAMMLLGGIIAGSHTKAYRAEPMDGMGYGVLATQLPNARSFPTGLEPGVIGSVPIGGEPLPPLIDPVSGYAYVPSDSESLPAGGVLAVLDGTTAIANITLPNDSFARGLGTFDTRNGLLYFAPSFANSTPNGLLYIVNNTSIIAAGRVGAGPDGVAFNSDNGCVYIANRDSDNISVYCGTTSSGSVALGFAPNGLVYDAADSCVYVLADGNITLVNDFKVIGSVLLAEASPYSSIAYSNGTGFIYVASPNLSVPYNPDANGTVTVIDDFSIESVSQADPGPGTSGIVVDPQGEFTYVTNGGMRGDGGVTIFYGSFEVGSVDYQSSHPLYDGAYDDFAGYACLVDPDWTTGSHPEAAVTVFDGMDEIQNISVGDGAASASYDPINGFVYVSNTDSDNVSVIWLAPPSEYPEEFTESGLPLQSQWYLNLTGFLGSLDYSASVTRESGSSITLQLQNGTYSYSVASSVKTWDTIASGTLTVAGSPGVSNVVWHPVQYAIEFVEHGLPTGAAWYVNVSDGPNLSSTVQAATGMVLTVELQNGSYAYSISTNAAGWTSARSNAVTVAGADVSRQVMFTFAAYEISFVESGLPTGTEWWINITGQLALPTMDVDLDTPLPNGSYTYSVGVANRTYVAEGDSFSVAGSTEIQPVTFRRVTFPVTLAESGLPLGTEWWTNVSGGPSLLSAGTMVDGILPNGTYHYSVESVRKDYSAPGSFLTVDGRAIEESVDFSLVTFLVTFIASNLTSGAAWWVNLSGQAPLESLGASVSTSVPNGSYQYSVGSADRTYEAGDGFFLVHGFAVSQTVVFTRVTYAVAFTGTAPAGGALWSVTLGGSRQSSSGSRITFSEWNGTFEYNFTAPSGYATVNATSGMLRVSGAPVVVRLIFTAITPEHSFTILGLPPVAFALLVGGATMVASAVGAVVMWQRRRMP